MIQISVLCFDASIKSYETLKKRSMTQKRTWKISLMILSLKYTLRGCTVFSKLAAGATSETSDKKREFYKIYLYLKIFCLCKSITAICQKALDFQVIDLRVLEVTSLETTERRHKTPISEMRKIT